MIKSEKMGIQGRLTIQTYDTKGHLLACTKANNSITHAGRTLVADLFNRDHDNSNSIKRVSMIHLGSGEDDFNPEDSGLKAKIGQVAIKNPIELITENNKVLLRMVGELDEKSCNGQLREAGLFTEDETPIMYNRVTFDTITKSEKFKLTLIWEIIF